ncbi:IS701 family transposase [Streptomyces sp. NPDC051956]|uniref:IS701 family transposase n=1 Tax=Streptomyces sp. NPDC051956 TaxID=3365677 RepID=UPI0037D60180
MPHAPHRAHPASGCGTPEPDLVGELAQQVLHSLPRSDQRRSGELYIRGLLAARGRKTIRNIASPTGQPADAQRLHHLVTDSTWDWAPVRRALIGQLGTVLRPLAWVVHTSTTPRAGRGAVGGDYFADPRAGAPVRGQRSAGLWAVTSLGAFPADWRLLLSPRWLGDPALRERAGIPEEATDSDSIRSGLDMLDALSAVRSPPHAPVLLDARGARAALVAASLTARGFPYLLRVSGNQMLVPAPARGRRTAEPVTARQLAEAPAEAGSNRLSGVGPSGAPREVTRHACRPAGAAPDAQQPQVLLAEKDPRGHRQTAYWLTDLAGHSTESLMKTAGTPTLVARDAAGTGWRVGLYDFEGRTFAGWHRHATLASVAYAATLLTSELTAPVTDVTCSASVHPREAP